MNETSPGGCCERSATWLREARDVRRVFESPEVSRDVEVSARLRLTMLGQRLVLHTCDATRVAV